MGLFRQVLKVISENTNCIYRELAQRFSAADFESVYIGSIPLFPTISQRKPF
jgi:hypothetical protein